MALCEGDAADDLELGGVGASSSVLSMAAFEDIISLAGTFFATETTELSKRAPGGRPPDENSAGPRMLCGLFASSGLL